METICCPTVIGIDVPTQSIISGVDSPTVGPCSYQTPSADDISRRESTKIDPKPEIFTPVKTGVGIGLALILAFCGGIVVYYLVGG